jgi:hypothetical protein
VVVADFNGDGVADLATADSGGNTVTLLLGNGLGGFNGATGSPFPAGSKPFALAAGDFNGNGMPGLAVANCGGNTVTLLLNTLSALTVEFSSLSFYGVVGRPQSPPFP